MNNDTAWMGDTFKDVVHIEIIVTFRHGLPPQSFVEVAGQLFGPQLQARRLVFTKN